MRTMFIKYLLMELKIWIYKFLIFYIIFYCPITFAQSIYGKAIIIDGDTIHIKKDKIRLHAIDAPEKKQTCIKNNEEWPCGLESTKALDSMIFSTDKKCSYSSTPDTAIFNSFLTLGSTFSWKSFDNSSVSVYSMICILESDKILKCHKTAP